jgi:hypothetical protein
MDWLKKQGVSTILLSLLVWNLPAIADKLEAERKETRDTFSAIIRDCCNQRPSPQNTGTNVSNATPHDPAASPAGIVP